MGAAEEKEGAAVIGTLRQDAGSAEAAAICRQGVTDVGEKVARSRRPENRDKVVALRPTPGSGGLAEVFLVPFQPQVPGDVNEAVKAQGEVDEKARQVYAGEAELPLQGLIDDGLGLTQIVQKIADAALNEPGCRRIVGDGEGLDQDAVEGPIESLCTTRLVSSQGSI